VVSFRPDAVKPPVPPPPTVRSSSVDRLDDDAPYEPSSLRESAKFSSRSETDVRGSGKEDVPSPKWLMQHYENIVRKNAAKFGEQVPRRRTRPVENHDHSGAYGSRENETSKPPAASLTDRKVLSSGSQSHVENIPPTSSYNRQNSQDRIGAPKVQPASGNVISRYGRPDNQPSTGLVSQKSAQSENAKPVVSAVESKDHNTAAGPGIRSSAKDDDDSVLRSFEDWKARRLSSGKYDESEKENTQQTFDEKPSSITSHSLKSVDSSETHHGLVKESAETESTKPAASESSLIFGVALRSTESKSEDLEAKSQNELGAELEAKVPDVQASVESHSSDPVSAPEPEVDLVGTLAKQDGENLTNLPPTDADKDLDMDDIGTCESGRRQSIELAEVPHFPRDSVMLTSPRSSHDDSRHPPPPSSPKADADDSVFTKEYTHAKPSYPQHDSHSLPLASTEPANGNADVLSADYLPPAETNQ